MATLEFGAILRHLRHAAGLSLRALAREIGVSPAYLSQVETGKEPVPAPVRLAQMEAALGLPTGQLLQLTDRIDPRALRLLQQEPGAMELLLAAEAAGFTDTDFRTLAMDVRRRSGTDAAPPVGPEQTDDAPKAASIALRAFLAPQRCVVQLDVADRAALFNLLTETLVDQDPALDAPTVTCLLHKREQETSTAVGGGIAIPHAWLPLYPNTTVTVATLQHGVVFDGTRDDPVTLVFLVLSAAPPSAQHVHMLARIARLCHDPAVCDALRTAPSSDVLYERLCAYDRKVA